MTLQALTRAGASVVTDDFLRSPFAPTFAPDQMEPFPRALALTQLEMIARDLLSGPLPEASELDALLVEALHRALPLTRREATWIGIWHWLAVAWDPGRNLVKARWRAGKDGRFPKERFLGGLTKNTFARLWWIAETTRAGDDYSITHQLMRRSQDMIQLVYEHSFGRHPPTVEVFLKLTEAEDMNTIRQLAKALRRIGVAMPLEALEPKEIQSVLRLALQGLHSRPVD